MFRGNWFNDFDTDPFFSPHQDQFSSFNSFFNHDPFRQALPEPSHSGHQQQRRSDMDIDNHHRQDRVLPFGRSMFGNMFSGFDQAFTQMSNNMGQLSDNPDAHCYSHSSVTSYSTGGDGQPKYFQATNSSRTGPGGVRETRKTVRDSERDLAKMEVGHHIGDRGHVIEKSRNTKTGQQEEKQNFIGIEQDQAASFNQEWEDKMGRHQWGALEGQTGRGGGAPALEGSGRRDKAEKRDKK